jgi:acid phosphatase (class A)
MGGMGAVAVPWGDGCTFPPFDPLKPVQAQNVGKLPGGYLKLPFDLTNEQEYPFLAWDPRYLAQSVLAEFASSGWQAHTDPGDWRHNDLKPEQEIRALMVLAATERPMRASEIAMQAEDAGPYWGNLLTTTPASRPTTWTLIEIGRAVGLMVAMHWKYKYRRPRPAQLCPALLPPLLTPPHASYPNAHALQSSLMSYCVMMVCSPAFYGPLLALARRVGENREIAGLHYKSDREASERIAPAVMKYLLKGPVFRAIMDAAAKEWSAGSRVLYPAPLSAERMAAKSEAFKAWLAEAKTRFPPLGSDLKEKTIKAFTDWLTRKTAFSDAG